MSGHEDITRHNNNIPLAVFLKSLIQHVVCVKSLLGWILAFLAQRHELQWSDLVQREGRTGVITQV